VARPANHPGWKSPLGLFVAAYGAEELAEAIGVVTSAVYFWVIGETIPRVVRAQKIVALATERGMDLTLADIYRVPKSKRPKVKTRSSRRSRAHA
jgi:hypothetical protein